MPELDAAPNPSAASPSQPGPLSARWRWAIYALVTLVLTLVFALYLQPAMMVTLAEQLWACF